MLEAGNTNWSLYNSCQLILMQLLILIMKTLDTYYEKFKINSEGMEKRERFCTVGGNVN